jgi:decaprenylphospho-beta-D-ribofuranose 2-oxidase
MNKTFTQLENFGHSLRSPAYVIKARSSDEIREAFRQAKQLGLTIAARGNGRSYNDASLNSGGIVLDTTGMNQITKWDPLKGIVTCEPGVTLQQLWQKALPDGWWLPVVSGTMFTTMGGCLSTNVHGKNNFHMGPTGEHVLEFTAILPTGARVTCSPKVNGDLFYAMISGMGMLGVFISVKLQMKKVYSGLLTVDAWPTHTLKEQLASLQENAPKYDYIVGWLDAITIGRGQIHAAKHLAPGEDPHFQTTTNVKYQDLPPRFFGVIPKSKLHYFMRPFWNNLGMWAVNTGRYVTGLRRHSFQQPYSAYSFYFDYVPNWELAYGRGGLVQYQSFLPKETALPAWTEILAIARKRGLPSYLGVTKRHRPDKFLLSHGVDGFSLALDFKVTDRNRAGLRAMFQDFDRIVLEAGGRFYFAKNSETTAETALKFYGKDTVAKFKRLKKRCDPNGLLESDLYRRVFGS